MVKLLHLDQKEEIQNQISEIIVENTRLIDYLDTHEKAIHGSIEFRVSWWDNEKIITARNIFEFQNVIE